jgi:CubicO group peptidase (beta-lactamase class C family)
VSRVFFGTRGHFDRLASKILTLLVSLLTLGDTTTLRQRPPAEVGMDADRLVLIDRAVKQGLAAGGFPGAAIVVGRGGAIVWQKGYGSSDWGFGLPKVDAQATIYDLASLTKGSLRRVPRRWCSTIAGS